MASHPNQLLHTLNWTPLRVRRKKQKAMVCRRILLGHSVIPSSHLTPNPCPNPRTKHSIPLLTPFARTILYQSSFFVSCVPIWNHLPESVISASSSHSFKVRLKTCPIFIYTLLFLHPVFGFCTLASLSVISPVLIVYLVFRVALIYTSIQLLFGLFPLCTSLALND